MLRRLLISLLDQPENLPRDTLMSVAIVDNDPQHSAKSVVEEFQARAPFAIAYAVEPHIGIPFARNRSLAIAGEADYVAFIDDDEIASERWLGALLEAGNKFSADIVIGPVVPAFEGEVANWISRSGLFDRDHYPTGHTPKWGRTGNALVARKFLNMIPGPFNEALALTGGADTHLFEQLKKHGPVMTWSEEGLVIETVPASRATAKWYVQRQFRLGNSAVWIDRQLPERLYRLVKRTLEGMAFFAFGLVAIFPSLLIGRKYATKALGAICRGVGIACALLGYRHEEYRRIHGS